MRACISSAASARTRCLPPARSCCRTFRRPAKPAGTNNEGLRRRGFSASDIATVRRAYRTLYRAGLSLEEARDTLAKAALDAPLLAPLVAFLSESGRGIVR